jgi:WD40 repeat protein
MRDSQQQTKVKGWPFLISRGKWLDYQPVVIPDFLHETRLSYLLLEAVTGEPTKTDTALQREIWHQSLGLVSAIFKIELAVQNDGEPYEDFYGRPIQWISGYLLRHDASGLQISREDFLDLARVLHDPFHNFWAAKANPPTEIAPYKLVNLERPSAQTLHLTHLEPYGQLQTQLPTINITPYHSVRFGRSILASALSYSGNTLALIIGHPNYVITYDLVKQDIIASKRLRKNSQYHSLKISSNGKLIVFVEEEQGDDNDEETKVRICDRSLDECRTVELDDMKRVTALEYSPVHDLLALGTQSGDCLVLNTRNQRWRKGPKVYDSPIRAISFNSSGSSIAIVASDDKLATFLVQDGEMKNPVTWQGRYNGVNSICFVPNRPLLATGGNEQVIRLWDIHKRGLIDVLDGHPDNIKQILASASGRTLISSGSNQMIKFWDMELHQEIESIAPPLEKIGSLGVSKNNLLSCTGDDEHLRVWKIHEGESATRFS